MTIRPTTISADRVTARSERQENGCLYFTGPICKSTGYGQVYIAEDRASQPAHRVIYQAHNGPIPKGMDICHTCDNRPCIEITHLFMGTRRDNVHDMMAKGRRVANPPKGVNNGISKMTEAKVLLLRKLVREGKTATSLGARFGISTVQAWNIATGRQWRHLPGAVPRHPQKHVDVTTITEAQWKAAAERVDSGSAKINHIAKELGVTFGAAKRNVAFHSASKVAAL